MHMADVYFGRLSQFNPMSRTLFLATFIDWLRQNYLWILIVIILIGVVIVIWKAPKPKQKTPPSISNESMDVLIRFFGGIDNIISCTIEGSRLTIVSKDVTRVSLSAIKELGAMGLFVSGNQVKLMFPFSADPFVTYVNHLKKEA